MGRTPNTATSLSPYVKTNSSHRVLPLKIFRFTLFTWENTKLAASWLNPSKLSPFGTMSRKSVWFFSTLGFWLERQGPQKNILVCASPSTPFPNAATFENSPPLPVKSSGIASPKRIPAAAMASLRKRILVSCTFSAGTSCWRKTAPM